MRALPDLADRIRTVGLVTVLGTLGLGFCLDVLSPTSGWTEGGLDVVQAAMVSLVALASATVPSLVASRLLGRWRARA